MPSSGRGRLGGVFLLHGDDAFRREEAARTVVERHLDPSTRDFNLDVVRGGEAQIDHLASVLYTPPMMAEWRVVHLREAEALASNARARDLLLRITASPPEGLAFVIEAEPPSRSKAKLWATLKREARSAEFSRLSEYDVPGWLVERAREYHGKELALDAARGLAAAVGTDLGILARELEKLREFVGDRRSIEIPDIEAAGTRLPRQDRWKWFDLVGGRRFEEAGVGLGILLDRGESGVGLVIGLATHLLRIGVALEGGQRALEGVLPPHQRWLAGRISAQTRGWTAEGIAEALEGLSRVDRLLKTSRLGDFHLLQSWLLELQLAAREAA